MQQRHELRSCRRCMGNSAVTLPPEEKDGCWIVIRRPDWRGAACYADGRVGACDVAVRAQRGKDGYFDSFKKGAKKQEQEGQSWNTYSAPVTTGKKVSPREASRSAANERSTYRLINLSHRNFDDGWDDQVDGTGS